jgi:glycine dehydrogenase
VDVHRDDGGDGLKRATEVAILNANYVAQRLERHFPVLYKGSRGRWPTSASSTCGRFRTERITVEDVAKRLMDYGFHSPTMSHGRSPAR